jgi:uncharacterized protein involved in exopolysaccharide biosynthesis
MSSSHNAPSETEALYATWTDESDLIDVALPLLRHWRLLLIGPLLAGVVAFGATYLISPKYTARTAFLPPQQPQSSASSALASLGALSALAGATSLRAPADQYVALLQSNTVADRLIAKFDLQQVYATKLRADSREEFAKNLRVSAGKKDGLITVEVEDESPDRAARIANQMVDELRRLTSILALTEAQQRRVFFESQLEATKARLTSAQQALQSSGFSAANLRAEPKAIAEGYAKMKAEVTAAEVRYQALRQNLTDQSPEVQTQQAALATLRAQLARIESRIDTNDGPDYIAKYREFKYQETLFDLFARQFELARLDESKEGALIQVVDPAVAPEKKSSPRRLIVAGAAAAVASVGLLLFVLLSHLWKQALLGPRSSQRLAELRDAVRWK